MGFGVNNQASTPYLPSEKKKKSEFYSCTHVINNGCVREVEFMTLPEKRHLFTEEDLKWSTI